MSRRSRAALNLSAAMAILACVPAATPAASKPAHKSEAARKESAAKGQAKTIPLPRPHPGRSLALRPVDATTGKAMATGFTAGATVPAAGGHFLPAATVPAAANPPSRVPLPRNAPSGRTVLASASPDEPLAEEPVDRSPIAALFSSPAPVAAPSPRASAPLAVAPTGATPAGDIAVLKRIVDLARKGKRSDAAAAADDLSDPVARKFAEWFILRTNDDGATLERYVAFIKANPGWPSVGLFRKKAEAALWEDGHSAATVRAFFAQQEPSTVKGRFALARALLGQGDTQAAAEYVRDAWRDEDFSRDVEAKALSLFGSLLTRADHKARMDRRVYAEDEDGLRIAQQLGGNEPAIAKARLAVSNKAGNAKALLDAVPSDARQDAGYMFSRIQWLRRNDQIGEAAQLMLAAPRDPAVIVDPDEWWVERRLIARKLLDDDNPKAAYRIARDAAPPIKDNNRVEQQFTAGWIAFRFLNDPATALAHFSKIGIGINHPTSLARAGYWQGRAAEALGRTQEARSHYQAAARHSAAYYGQLARARLGLPELGLNGPPDLSGSRGAALMRLEVVRVVEILYALGERDLIIPVMIDLGEKTNDVSALAMVGEIARRNNDPRGMLYMGKAAVARGLPLEYYAFPAQGVPGYSPVGPQVEQSIVYSIARQESAFNPKAVSSAKAMGLLQVTADTGRFLAKKFGAAFDGKRLLHDPVYNTQIGAAGLGNMIDNYRGSYILTFVGYNAGPGRVKEWIARYGDPREPDVDPIDWVERIPFSETRNYVQRVMENVQVYRARFGNHARLLIDSDMRRGMAQN